MAKTIHALFFAFMAVCAFFSILCAGPQTGSPAGSGDLPFVVSASWLADHLHDPNLVLLHVSSHRKDFLKGHIPGARFLWPDWLVNDNPDLSYELMSVPEMKERLEDLGVSDNSEIVLYFGGSELTTTTRMFFTLDYLGLAGQTRILDGGLNTWTAAKRPLSTDTTAYARGSFTPHVREEALTTGDWVAGHLHDKGIRLVDARSASYYTGASPTWNKKGHIPGAVSIPYNSVADTVDKFKDPATLRAMFRDAGIKPDDRIIPYCHVGQQASLIYFIAKNLGYSVSFYDGAFEDWASRTDAPVELAHVVVPKPGKGEKLVYVCPMDRDVVAKKPGNCPKCGMTLEAKIVPAVNSKPKKG